MCTGLIEGSGQGTRGSTPVHRPLCVTHTQGTPHACTSLSSGYTRSRQQSPAWPDGGGSSTFSPSLQALCLTPAPTQTGRDAQVRCGPLSAGPTVRPRCLCSWLRLRSGPGAPVFSARALVCPCPSAGPCCCPVSVLCLGGCIPAPCVFPESFTPPAPLPWAPADQNHRPRNPEAQPQLSPNCP